MPTIILNGRERTIPDGVRMNAIQAAQYCGEEIPYYCWHPALSVVASCRMCEILTGTRDPKTGEIKMNPRLVPGCQTAVVENTVLDTASPAVKEHQRMIMELLLLNHPLDCPVCDQAGECGLQDYSYERGQSNHRFVEERTVNPRKAVGDNIQLNQDRCILCTRCVRFTREISQTGELQVAGRGHHSEIEVFPGNAVNNPIAGNVVDLCPVGALLDTDFLHVQRVWYLSKNDGICTGCATGCNISSEDNKGKIQRIKPRPNPEVNDFWICDEGRYHYKHAHAPDLLPGSFVLRPGNAEHQPIAPETAVAEVRDRLGQAVGGNGRLVGVLSPFLTVEEAFVLARWWRSLDPQALLVLGPVPVVGQDRTFTPDAKTGRTGDTSFLKPRPFTIHAEKAPNRRGVAEIIAHFAQGNVTNFDDFLAQAASQTFGAIYVTLGDPLHTLDETEVATLRKATGLLIVQDGRRSALADQADYVLASGTFAEKAGTYVNAQGRLQYSRAVLPPRSVTLPDLDWACALAGIGGDTEAPVSGAILADLAQAAPSFAGLTVVDRLAQVPPLGWVIVGSPAEKEKASAAGADSANAKTMSAPATVTPPVFRDTWTKHKMERV